MMLEKDLVAKRELEFIDAVKQIAYGLADIDAARGTDATGGTVGCVTEALMGVTAGLVQIADALREVAQAFKPTGYIGVAE